MRIGTGIRVAVAFAALAGQGASACGDGAGGEPDADADADADTDADADADTDADSDSDAEAPICVQTCDDAADCVPSTTTAIADADNYECAGGLCAYLGCNSTAECQQALSSELFGCTSSTGLGSVPGCAQACDDVGDCITEYATPAYDEDNYVCNGEGFCEYTGCNDSEECDQSAAGYLCGAAAGLPVDLCQAACEEPADCGTGVGAFDEDNYDCVDGLCEYLGCDSAEECEQSLGSSFTCVTP
jgi:hypothetical protein